MATRSRMRARTLLQLVILNVLILTMYITKAYTGLYIVILSLMNIYYMLIVIHC